MKKRGLSNQVQIILIIIIAVVLAGTVAVFINQSITRSGQRIDAEVLVLQSEFSIMSVRNDPGGSGFFEVSVRREAGTGTYPTIVMYGLDIDDSELQETKSYDGGDITVYQTATVKFNIDELINQKGWDKVSQVEVYASTKDASGAVVNSRNPKDIVVLVQQLVSPGQSECGNGVVEADEGCDDDNLQDGDGCDSNCQVEIGWDCNGEPSVCNEVCGDGRTVGGEFCDDGPDNGCGGYEGCDDTCSEILECGDGEQECSEECDDGNGNNNDGCIIDEGESYECMNAVCGDGYLLTDDCEPNCEECDGTNWGGIVDCEDLGYQGGGLDCFDPGSGSECRFDTSGCVPFPDCGDGDLDPGEECDDGQDPPVDGDGCSATCQIEHGWDCINDPMPSVCSTTCGDGLIGVPIEECDDDNLQDGDGCDSNCQVEIGWDCNGEPSVCEGDCGDGFAVGVEDCDDGITTDTYYLESPSDDDDECVIDDLHPEFSCMDNVCGDGYWDQDSAEECDDGPANSDTMPGACRESCVLPYCGDGVCDPGEGRSGGLSPPLTGYATGSIEQGQYQTIIHAYRWDPYSQQYYNGGPVGDCPQDCGDGPPDIWRDWEIIDLDPQGYNEEDTSSRPDYHEGIGGGDITTQEDGGGGIQT